MVKKILGIVLGCSILLVVLLFFLLLLVQYQDFFGQAVTWVVCGGIIILMLFVLYIMVSLIIDAVQKNKHDEDNLSEKSIEKILSGKAPEALVQSVQLPVPIVVDDDTAAREQKRLAIEEKALQNKAEHEAKMAAEEEKLQNEQVEQSLQIAETAEQRMTGAFPVLQAADAKEAPAQEAKSQPIQEDPRKAQAVASARKQAEAAATARRIAAQAAARTQAFAALDPDNLPVSATGAFPAIADQPTAGSESIWEKMAVRQSAAPQLSSREHIPTAQYRVGASGTLSPLSASTQQLPSPAGGVHATGTLYHTQSIPVLNADGTVRGQAPRVTQTAQMPLQGRPVAPRTGQPLPPRAGQQTAQIRPVTGHPTPRPPQPTAQIPAQGRPVAPRPGQPLPPRPVQHTAAIPVPPLQATGPIPKSVGGPVQGEPATNKASEQPVVPPVVHTPVKLAPVVPVPSPDEGSASEVSAPASSGKADVVSTAPTSSAKPVPGKEPSSSVKKKPDTAGAKDDVKEEPAEPVKRPRGRPPKPKDPEEENKPKRPRGRPPKPKDPEEENKPKRPRGRPRKHPLPEDAAKDETKTTDDKKQA